MFDTRMYLRLIVRYHRNLITDQGRGRKSNIATFQFHSAHDACIFLVIELHDLKHLILFLCMFNRGSVQLIDFLYQVGFADLYMYLKFARIW